jgi:general secretion pathway protein D
MQERQEYLDRYFVFSDNNDYHPARDYNRTNGLVEDIRQAFFQIEEKKRLDDLTKPRELKSHLPQKPLEMPQLPRTGASGAAGAPAAGVAPVDAPSPKTTPQINVNPATRNLERIEK